MRLIVAFLLVAPLLPGANLIRKWSTRLNTTTFEMAEGSAEIEFLSDTTFRFQRCDPGAICVSRASVKDLVPITSRASSRMIEFQTDVLVVQVWREDCTISVQHWKRGDLFQEVDDGEILEWTATEKEKFFGLGMRSDSSLDLRGRKIRATRPLLISSLGYGIFMSTPGPFEFDLGKNVKVSGGAIRGRVEFLFYYGPEPKDILSEHHSAVGSIQGVQPAHTGVLGRPAGYSVAVDAKDAREAITRLSHGSLSGILAGAVDLASRFGSVGPWLPMVFQSAGEPDPNAVAIRRRMSSYLLTYLWEARDSNTPMLRPLRMQYPEDPETEHRLDEFMLGDELLVGGGDSVYLPRGIWTDLRTNKAHRGKQTIDARGEGAAVYARNGSIVPMTPGSLMELHYFPRLGAEYFIAEPSLGKYSKAHAGPALDILRLEIEPIVTRDYEWVVHNVSRASGVEAIGVDLEPNAWRYDEVKRNLHIRVSVPKESDAILKVTLEEPL